MNGWLLDASVMLAAEDPADPNHEAAHQVLEGSTVVSTPDLAYYEVTNVAMRSWRDPEMARVLRHRVTAVGGFGGLVRIDEGLAAAAANLAAEVGISAYDAAYAAAAHLAGVQLVSCDVRDLVSRGMAILPRDAVSSTPAAGFPPGFPPEMGSASGTSS